MNKPFDPTKPVQTRDGRPARILDVRLKSSHGGIVAVVYTGDQEERVFQFHDNGQYYLSEEVSFDLVNVPTKVLLEGWINVYPIGTNEMIHPTRESADRWEQGVDVSRIACIHLRQEVSEGEGL